MAWPRIQRFLDRIESRATLLQYLMQGAAVMTTGAATGWVAYVTEWIASYGPIGWWSAGLLGALVAAIVLLVFSWARYAWIHAAAKRTWEREVDKVNPLSSAFRLQRILLSDLAHPISKAITGKNFNECELIGPANVVIVSDCTLTESAFCNCDIVVVHENGRVGTAIGVIGCSFYRTAIWNCTVFIHHSMVGVFAGMGAEFVSLTGDQQIDSQLLKGNAQKRD